MFLQLVKIVLIFQIGLFALLVAYDNVVDYGTNYAFVRHVLTMDTTFSGNPAHGSGYRRAGNFTGSPMR